MKDKLTHSEKMMILNLLESMYDAGKADGIDQLISVTRDYETKNKTRQVA